MQRHKAKRPVPRQDGVGRHTDTPAGFDVGQNRADKTRRVGDPWSKTRVPASNQNSVMQAHAFTTGKKDEGFGRQRTPTDRAPRRPGMSGWDNDPERFVAQQRRPQTKRHRCGHRPGKTDRMSDSHIRPVPSLGAWLGRSTAIGGGWALLGRTKQRTVSTLQKMCRRRQIPRSPARAVAPMVTPVNRASITASADDEATVAGTADVQLRHGEEGALLSLRRTVH